MNCPEVRRVIYKYLDGELSKQEERVLFAHLSGCYHCQEEFQLARETHHLLENSITYVEPPEGFTQRVMDTITELDLTPGGQEAGTLDVPLPEAQQDKKPKWLFTIPKGGVQLARVASFVVLLAATSAIFLYNATPHLPKISFNRETGAPSLVERVLGEVEKSGSKEQPSTESPEIPSTGETPLEGEGEREHQSGEVKDHEAVGEEPTTPLEAGTEQEPQGETPPPQDRAPKSDPGSQKQPGEKTPQQPPSGEEGINNPLPRLEGPIIAATMAEVNPLSTLPLTPLVVDEHFNTMPDWTSEGQRITYLSTKEAPEGSYSLWSLDLTGNEARLISDNVKKYTNLAQPSLMSPDGKYTIQVADSQVWVKTVDSGEPEAVTPKLEAQKITATWSPDGQKIAISVKSRNHDHKGLWLAENSSQGWKLTLGTKSGGGEVLSWSPDGQKLAFTNGQNTIYLLCLGSKGDKPQLYQVVPRGDNLGSMSLSWSRDSNKLLFDWAKPDSKQRGIYLVEVPN